MVWLGTEEKEEGAQVQILGNKWLSIYKGHDDERGKGSRKTKDPRRKYDGVKFGGQSCKKLGVEPLFFWTSWMLERKVGEGRSM